MRLLNLAGLFLTAQLDQLLANLAELGLDLAEG
jgi:hypothetical protein